MRLEPADDDWKSMRIAPWKVPVFSKEVVGRMKKEAETKPEARKPSEEFMAKEFSARRAGHDGVAWQVVPGLGRSGSAVTLLPVTRESFELASDADVAAAPKLEYALEFPAAGNFSIRLHLLPMHALVSGRGLRVRVAVDDAMPQRTTNVIGDGVPDRGVKPLLQGRPQVVTLDLKDGGPEWAQGVLSGERTVETTVTVDEAGRKTLCIYGVDAGVVLDRISVRGMAAMAP